MVCARVRPEHNIKSLLPRQDNFRHMAWDLRIGTACSGTEIFIAALSTMLSSLTTTGIFRSIRHVFACDSKASVRQFIATNWEPEVRFCRVRRSARSNLTADVLTMHTYFPHPCASTKHSKHR